MIKTTYKGLLAHKLRFVMTGLAIALGVAFMAGTMIFNATLRHGFDSLVETGSAGTDVVVRSPEAFKSEFGSQREPVDTAVLDRLLKLPGVAAGDVSIEGYAQLVDKNGDAVKTPGGNAPTLGLNWVPIRELNGWRLAAGREPIAPDEVVIDLRSAKQEGFEVGDLVTVLTQGPPQRFRLVGTARWGEVDTPLGATAVLFPRGTAQRVLGEPGKADSIQLVAADGISQESLRELVTGDLRGQKLEVLTGQAAQDEAQADIRDALSFINTFLLVFALIALFVGSFIIFNTFSITVAQRQRQTALLRAIGASRVQVTLSVVIEALVIGIVAAGLGLALGIVLAIGLRELLASFGMELPSVKTQIGSGSLLTAFVVGTVVTVIAAVVPAQKAASVPPMAALRDVAVEPNPHTVERTLAGVFVVLLGGLALGLGLFSEVGSPLALIGGGAAVVFLGVAVLAPAFARPLSGLVGAPLELRGMTGHLARENAMRNPRRTSATASALMVGVALVSVITILAASTKASAAEQIDGSMQADFVVTTSANMWAGGFSPTLAQQLRAVDGVETTSGIRMGPARIGDATRFVAGISPAAFVQLWDLGKTEGDLEGLSDVGIAVSKTTADDKGWTLGSAVPVTFARTGVDTFRVEAIYDEGGQMGDFLVNTHAYDRNFVQSLDNQIGIELSPGVSLAQGRAAIEPVLEAFPNVELQDRGQLKSSIGAQIDQMLNLVYALLALAVIIALIGIANTLALSIHERTRELGLLRAVGLTRPQLRAVVRWEALLISVLGTVLGLAVGGGLGWALVTALRDDGMTVLSLPAAQLATIAVIAALAGVVAAIRPSRRAARLDVLRAITTE